MIKYKTVERCEDVPDDLLNGAAIRELREKNGVSLRRLAKAMKISPPYLSDLENGNRGFSKHRFEEAQTQIAELK